MYRTWLVVVALLATVAQAQVPEVDQNEVLRRGDAVEYIAGAQAEWLAALSPPADDRDKWFISVISMQGCPGCQQLKRDWRSNEWLQSLADPESPKESWAHFNLYDKDDQSQSWRFKKIKVEAYPTILVQPPRSGRYGDPKTIVFQGIYRGDPKDLAKEIVAAIRKYVAKLKPQRPRSHEQAVGVDPPWDPTPKVEPEPAPTPAVDPLDVIQIPPEVQPTPKPAVAPVLDGYPEAVVVTDSLDGLSPDVHDRIRSILTGLESRRGKSLKIRFMDWEEARQRYPVQRDEVPVVLMTSNGRIEDKLSARLLPFVETEPKTVTLSDIPWPAILTLVSTGFSLPAAVALGIFAVRFVRSRREKLGKPLLVDDATFQQILAALQAFANTQVKQQTK
jgi:hypothetical protein